MVTRKTREELEGIKANKNIIKAIKEIKDPEFDVDIWLLGLIYDIAIDGKKVEITLTFTSPACPSGPQIMYDIKTNLKKIGFEPNIKLVFSPPWEATEEMREILGV
jgi:metal-sulfur cluster biosynthetic enzyme